MKRHENTMQDGGHGAVLTLNPFSADMATALSAMPFSMMGLEARITPLHVMSTRDFASSRRPMMVWRRGLAGYSKRE